MKYPEHVPNNMEIHDEKSRGWYFPRSIISLFESGDLTEAECFLLGKINSLVDADEGCYASNQYLANWWRRSPAWVSETISKFKKLGLVRVVMDTSDRRKTVRRVWTTYQFDGHPHRVKPHTPTESTPIPPLSRTRATNDTSYHKKNTCDARASGVSDFGLNGKYKLARFTEDFAEFTIKRKYHTGAKGSTIAGWRKETLEKWDKGVRQLRSLVGKELLRKVMDWYFEHYRDEFVPQCRTLPRFCERFQDVKAAMDRDLKARGLEEDPPSEAIERTVVENGRTYKEYILPVHRE